MLILPEALRSQLATWIRAGYPYETCGVLLGRVEAERTVVSSARAARNLERARACERYELDPAALVAADRDARAAALEIVGIWHSHPDRSSAPSESDRTGAWSGWSYVIASVSSAGVSSLRAWRLERERFVEEELCA